MLFIYNSLQILFLILFAPLILAIILIKDKYRCRILRRLGQGLTSRLGDHNHKKKKTVWLHALSVGEVTSAVVLIKGIREKMADSRIVVTTSTKSGGELAERLLADHADILLDSPIDILPVINYFINKIQPDLFILVETDFWPNMLFALRRNNIPSVLVNGRISRKSMLSYCRFDFFFSPLFNTFSALCMQTATDKKNMISLAINENKIHTLGNLKYDASTLTTSANGQNIIKPPQHSILWLCGSTHKGEEEIILSTYTRLKKDYPQLYLIIAPRDIDRARDILQLGNIEGLTGNCQSDTKSCVGTDFHILDTIGELASLYHQADIAFIGGSLVDQGGHNPIEAALAGIPVLFGLHMEDFEEISDDLVRCGGAYSINDSAELFTTLQLLLKSETKRENSGKGALNNIKQQRGVISRHLKLINKNL